AGRAAGRGVAGVRCADDGEGEGEQRRRRQRVTQARAGSRAGAEGRAGAPGGPEAPPPDGGGSAVYAAAPLRHTSLTALARRVPRASPAPDRWAEALRVLDVLDAVLRARRPLGTGEIAVAARLHPSPLALLLDWLCGHLLLVRLPDGAFTAGPLFRPDTGGDPVLRRGALRQVLDELRESTGAAVYVSRYAAGEVEIQHCADGPDTPAVHQWVDFREAAHASAVGKCLMAQLDFGARMDHLARHRPVRLTDRTITDPAALFRTLDGHGPHAGQFDLLEYSRHEVCAAVPLTVAGRPACVALSLPVIRGHRLTRAARTLSDRSGLLLLTLIAALPVDGDPARWNPRPGPRGRAADPTGPSPGTAYTAFSPSVGSGWTAAASGLAHPASLLAPLPEHGPAEARRPR
ncbi:IclR family transcriptional regulator C-terminal domain-containing protein, partial [Streptomyces sp. NPDC048577]|uniref:IclR family transcriptional regulator domain-containing protein n=1 Tax=Streptomyces sp. NPDC048577 TaxID=3157209 RepID=UPI00343E7FEC